MLIQFCFVISIFCLLALGIIGWPLVDHYFRIRLPLFLFPNHSRYNLIPPAVRVEPTKCIIDKYCAHQLLDINLQQQQKQLIRKLFAYSRDDDKVCDNVNILFICVKTSNNSYKTKV